MYNKLNFLWWFNFLIIVIILICFNDRSFLNYLIINIFILSIYNIFYFMKIFKILNKISYLLAFVFGLLNSIASIIYYYNLNLNRISELLFIFIIFFIIKITAINKLPKFLDLK